MERQRLEYPPVGRARRRPSQNFASFCGCELLEMSMRPIAPDYRQQFLLPPCLEDWVPADHPARFIREFVDQLDLVGLEFRQPATEGRPPYATSLLLKIWLYGYFHHIRSCRKLEVACRQHLSLLWLTGLIQPDHNSLWRFWRDNRPAIRQLFRQTVAVAQHSGAVGLLLQALDGTKIEAAASGYSGWSRAHMEKLRDQLDALLDQTEQEIAAAATATPETTEGYRLPASLSERQALRAQIQAGLEQLQADNRNHYHPIEPEARRMKVGGNNRFAYNAQAVADAQEGIIVSCEVTRQETDNEQLVPMIEQAQQNLGGVAAPTTVADSGYGAGADLQAAAEKNLPVLVHPLNGRPSADKPYASQQFHYDAQQRSVRCPQGRLLDYQGSTRKQDQVVQRYRCHCRDCPVRADCTRDPKGRMVEIWPHTAEVQAMRERLQQDQNAALLRQRSQIIERRFAQLKAHEGFRRWTLRGLAGVQTQWALLCATLNRRVLYRRWQGQQGAALAAVRRSCRRGSARRRQSPLNALDRLETCSSRPSEALPGSSGPLNSPERLPFRPGKRKFRAIWNPKGF